MRNAPICVVANVVVTVGVMLGSSLRTPILADVVIDVDAVFWRVFKGVPAKTALEVLGALRVDVDPVDGRMRSVIFDPLLHPLLICFAGRIALADGAIGARIGCDLNAATGAIGVCHVMHFAIDADMMYLDD